MDVHCCMRVLGAGWLELGSALVEKRGWQMGVPWLTMVMRE